MEARGVYGWNDPIEPDGAARRPEPAADEPAWLTDHPEPRSAYLFGDDPDRPADEWSRQQPTARWQPEPDRRDAPPRQPAAAYRDEPARRPEPTSSWQRDEPTGSWQRAEAGGHEPTTAWQHAEPTGSWQHAEPTGSWQRDEPTGGWQRAAAGSHEPPTAWQRGENPGWPREEATASWRSDEPTAGWRPAAATGEWRQEEATGGWAGTPTGAYPGEPVTSELPATGAPAVTVGAGQPPVDGGHRRRLPRPVLIGGAAAAATLVVSLGVGALALSGGDGRTPTSAVDNTVATAPALAESAETPAEALAPTSPSAVPTTATPSPSVTPSSKPSARSTPAVSRSTATSRRAPARTTAPATSGTTAAPSGGSVSAQASEVVDLVNAERAKAGCGALSIDDKLMLAAQRHSQDQADHQKMSHDGSDDSDPGERINRVGYEWSTYGENVAWNQRTPAAVMDAWMNSSGHRKNILNCDFTEIGVGIASSNGPYWTQVFAAPR
ncbi:CAP domain-containing protein [Micromonospora sp. WMMA1363]|uniref:CAP domain-containing protein n=1 Tax=Micromonospora sp. WMMA1363 TaxID=3053985 RepID=UPI00259CDA9E|nr:CAP domain-containing protein [Micromonospora sp. WMMA1363]MDM4722947.1 CAP domain-containing protein [Micromonospora sp. WMMA1363]